MYIESVMPSSHLILCHPFLLPPSNLPSTGGFSSDSVLHIKWPKYCCFNFSVKSFQRIFRVDFLNDWLVWSPCSPGDSQESFSNTTDQSINSLAPSFLYSPLSHPYMTTGKTTALTRWTLVGKVMSLLFNMLSRFSVVFLPRSKCLLISCLQSSSAVVLEHKKRNSVTISIVSPFICHEVMGPDTMILVFWMLSFKPAFSLSSFTYIKRLFTSSSLSAIMMVSSAYMRLLTFLLEILIPACASSSPAFCMI